MLILHVLLCSLGHEMRILHNELNCRAWSTFKAHSNITGRFLSYACNICMWYASWTQTHIHSHNHKWRNLWWSCNLEQQYSSATPPNDNIQKSNFHIHKIMRFTHWMFQWITICYASHSPPTGDAIFIMVLCPPKQHSIMCRANKLQPIKEQILNVYGAVVVVVVVVVALHWNLLLPIAPCAYNY